MNEQNTVGIDVQARILPLLNTQEFEQSLQNLPNQVNQNLNQVINSPGFQEGLSSQQLNEVQQWMKYNQGLTNPMMDRIRDLLEDMNVDLSTGSLSKSQINKYTRKFERMKYDAGEMGEDYVSDARDFLKSLDPEHLSMITGAIKNANDDIGNNVDKLKDKFRDLTTQIKESNNGMTSFFDELRRAGVFTLAGEGVNAAINYLKVGAQISGREMTSFDLSSPLAEFGQRRQFETYRDIMERSRTYQTIGEIAGGAIGFATGTGPLGALALGYIGKSLGGGIAELQNIPEQALTEQQLKLLDQTYGVFGSYVSGAVPYDVARAQLRARLRGQDATSGIGREVGLGISPEQALAFRGEFANTSGYWNENLYNQQLTFATALGLNPEQIMQLNISGRMTGANYGIGGLNQARQFTQELYGSGVVSDRIIEVLNAIKNINEKMLSLNINADAREGMKYAQVPELLFGNGSPYGRIDQMGGTTLNLLQEMMQPRTEAQQAFLFRALGTNNIQQFTEMMKGGIFSGNNLEKIFGQLRGDFGQNSSAGYFALNELIPNAPQGFLPDLVDILMGNGRTITRNKLDSNGNPTKETETVTMTYSRLLEEMENYRKTIEKSNMTEGEKNEKLKQAPETLMGFYQKMAEDAKSASEKFMSAIHEKELEAADSFRNTVMKMREDWVHEMTLISNDTDNRHKMTMKLIEAEQQAIEGLHSSMSDMGIYMGNTDKIMASARDQVAQRRAKALHQLGNNPWGSHNSEDIENGIPAGSIDYDKLNAGIDKLNSIVEKLNNGIKVDVALHNDPSAASVQNSAVQ